MNDLPELNNPFIEAKIVGKNIDPLVYQKDNTERGNPLFVMSRSGLMRLLASPSKWKKGDFSEGTDATDLGTLFDAKLTLDDWQSRFVTQPAEYENEAGEIKPWSNNAKVCKKWHAGQAGKTVITQKEDDKSALMVERMLKDSRIKPVLDGAEFSVMVLGRYKDRETGIEVPVKGLIDVLPTGGYRDTLADIKTARDGNPTGWPKVIFEHDYDVQSSLYLDLYETATGEGRNKFIHLISENQPPYEPERSSVSEEFLKEGRAVYISALQLYCRCLAENHWPSASDLKGRDYNGWPIAQMEAWMVGRRFAA
jgi:hypothetical protein